jgi:hypothetical protein
MNQRTTHREKLQIRGELFALCSAGGDANLKRAASIIRKMSPEERRDVRAGIQTLSELIDDVWLGELREKRIASGQRA